MLAALEQTCSSMVFVLLKNNDLPGALKIYQMLSRFNLWPTIRTSSFLNLLFLSEPEQVHSINWSHTSQSSVLETFMHNSKDSKSVSSPAATAATATLFYGS